MNKLQRVSYVDVAKGLGLLLVVVGHTLVGSRWTYLNDAVYSFHMPLFFVLTGLTIRPSDSWSAYFLKLKKLAIYLFGAAIIITALRLLPPLLIGHHPWGLFSNGVEIADLKRMILMFVYPTAGFTRSLFAVEVPNIGIPWFFIALFSARAIYEGTLLLAGEKGMRLAIVPFLIAGYVLNKIVVAPLLFDLALIASVFIWVGRSLKTVEWSRGKTAIAFLLWMLFMGVEFAAGDSHLTMIEHKFPIYPLCIGSAITGSVALVAFARWLDKLSLVRNGLSYLGSGAIFFLAIHTLDYYWMRGAVGGLPLLFIRLCSDLLVFYVLMRGVKYLRERCNG